VKTKRVLVKLFIKQSAELYNLITEEYVSSEFHNQKFAEYASQKLGFTFNASHVEERRKAAKLPLNPVHIPVPKKLTLQERVELLEDAVNKLEKLTNK
jgi:myosin-crossreactive antigen